jgi:hypothetical protein
VLEILVATALLTGVTSLTIGTGWTRWLTAVHGIAGFSVLVLAPAKARGSVRTGLHRRRGSRFASLALAALIATTIFLGVVHSTGLWFGVGYWSPLWTHVLAAVVVAVLVVWHVLSRPDRPKLADLDRRALLRSGAAVSIAAAAYGTQEVAVRVLGSAGGDRRFTGSHEIASFDPQRMPTVSWINDRAPESTDADSWRLTVAGGRVPISKLRGMAEPVVAAVDCTGGWWSQQSWDAVPLAALLADHGARSIRITSSTGYDRLFPAGDADRLYLAVGYGGQPLRRGHGAPVRLVAPGRRGPWWVKWVSSVEPDDRPWWLQLPLPIE